MGLVDDIRNQVKKAGANKSKLIYFKEGTKIRVRFLQDMEEGMKLAFHDSFAASVNIPCQEAFGKECSYCENEDLRTRDQYAWSVWDHDAKEVKMILAPVNNASPIPALVAMYEAYGTLLDRDYVITKNGKGTTTTYTVVPQDKVKFRNDKAKPFSKQKALDIIDKAFPDDASDDDAGAKKKSTSVKSKKQQLDDDDDDDTAGYSEMTAKELYDECKKRGIEAAPKKPTSHYIVLLEANDSEQEADEDDDWGDEDGDDSIDYTELSAKELFELCKERGIKVEPKKPAEIYIKKLEAYDEEHQSSTDDGDDDEW